MAAANEDAESPDVVIKSLPADRRRTVEATARQMLEFQKGITQRGQRQLLAMSDEEWQRLVSGG